MMRPGFIARFKNDYARRSARLRKEGIFSYLRGSSGYVLILVMVITTLLISLSSEFLSVAQTNIGYIRKTKNRVKADFLAQSGIELGKYILYADMKGVATESITGKSSNKDIDSYNDIWAIDLPELPFDDGTLKIVIEDENAKINLSVLANEFTDKTKYYYMTRTFFMNLGLLPDFADIIHDWVDIDDSRMPYGAETHDYYATLPRPYAAKNNAMDSIDEMLMLKGMTPEIYYGFGGGNFGTEHNLVEHNKGDITLDLDRISAMTGRKDIPKDKLKDTFKDRFNIGKEKSRRLPDYFTVYGDRNDYTSDFNKININTASFRVLSALTENITPDIVTEIINRRLVQPFKEVNEIKDLIVVNQEDEKILDRLSVKSNIFRIIATATVDNASVTVQAVYNRSTRKVLYWSQE